MWPHILAGLITEVTEEQQIALVEYIAHLTCEDWVAVSNDLVALGGWPCQTTSWLWVGGWYREADTDAHEDSIEGPRMLLVGT